MPSGRPNPRPEDFGIDRSEIVEYVGDVPFADPFRVLEEESPRVLAWQRAMNDAALGAFAAAGRVDALRDALSFHLGADEQTLPTPAGDRWLWLERDLAGRGRRVLVSRRADERPSAVLVTCDDMPPLDGAPSIDWLVPSPDGKLAALGVSSHGDEQATLVLVDTASGAVVEPGVRHLGGPAVAWLPDASGLYCCAGRGPDAECTLKRLVFVEPGGRVERVAAPPGVECFWPVVQVSADGRHVALASLGHHPALLYVHDRATGTWHAPLFEDPEVFFGVFVGEEYVAVTTYGAPRGRLVAAPAARVAERTSWRELVPEGGATLRTVAPFGEHLLLYELAEGVPRLRVVSRAGEPIRTVPLPSGLVVASGGRPRSQLSAEMPVRVAGASLLFAASSVDRSTTLWRYDAGADRLEELTEPGATLPGVVAETLRCSSSDGEEVRYDVVRPPASRRTSPGPTVLVGYGGFNMAWLPKAYPSLFAPWVTAGGTYVFAHVRGDGTDGTDRWHAGRREGKATGLADFFAVAEDLVARGIATPERLAIVGASNGGLLVSAAVTQRPELFGAAAILAPVVDTCRALRDRFGEAFVDEHGDPRRPEDARWMRAFSPYHAVTAGLRHPPVAIVCGDRDLRTPTWHGRKLAAVLQANGDSDSPVLLRVHENRGHAAVGMDGPPDGTAEWLGFLMEAVGLTTAAA